MGRKESGEHDRGRGRRNRTEDEMPRKKLKLCNPEKGRPMWWMAAHLGEVEVEAAEVLIAVLRVHGETALLLHLLLLRKLLLLGELLLLLACRGLALGGRLAGRRGGWGHIALLRIARGAPRGGDGQRAVERLTWRRR